MKRRGALCCCGCAGVVALALWPLSGAAQDVDIARGDCSRPVHLVARDVPLSKVLKDLSEKLNFTVVYQAQADPLVNTDARSYPTDLVRALARNMNFSLEETRDPRCAQGRRIAKLSVLPDPSSGNRGTVASARPAWMTPEMERIGRLTMQDYLKSHGVPEPSTEGTAVH